MYNGICLKFENVNNYFSFSKINKVLYNYNQIFRKFESKIVSIFPTAQIKNKLHSA